MVMEFAQVPVTRSEKDDAVCPPIIQRGAVQVIHPKKHRPGHTNAPRLQISFQRFDKALHDMARLVGGGGETAAGMSAFRCLWE